MSDRKAFISIAILAAIAIGILVFGPQANQRKAPRAHMHLTGDQCGDYAEFVRFMGAHIEALEKECFPQ